MKKFVKAVSVIMSVVLVCLVFASCGGGLSGKYAKSEGGTTVAFDFNGKNVEMSISVGGLSYSVDGTYEIEDDTITFSFDAPDGDASWVEGMLAGFEQSIPFEKGNGYIKLNGETFEKE